MSPLQRGETGRRTCVLRPVVWAVMSGEAGEFGVSDHFREVTKMIVPGSGSTGKSGTICRIPDSSDLKSPIRCTVHRSTFALYGNGSNHAEPHKVTRNRACRAWFAEAWTGVIRLRGRKNLCGFGRD